MGGHPERVCEQQGRLLLEVIRGVSVPRNNHPSTDHRHLPIQRTVGHP